MRGDDHHHRAGPFERNAHGDEAAGVDTVSGEDADHPPGDRPGF